MQLRTFVASALVLLATTTTVRADDAVHVCVNLKSADGVEIVKSQLRGPFIGRRIQESVGVLPDESDLVVIDSRHLTAVTRGRRGRSTHALEPP